MQEELKALKEHIKFLEKQIFHDRLVITIATILCFIIVILIK